MASDKRMRRHGSVIRRAWLFCLFLALPALILAAFLFYLRILSLAPALLLAACLLLYLDRKSIV